MIEYVLLQSCEIYTEQKVYRKVAMSSFEKALY